MAVALGKFNQRNPPSSRYKRKEMIESARFIQIKSRIHAEDSNHRCKPYTQASFVMRCTTKFGLIAEQAKDWFSNFKANPHIERDNDGYGGVEQLYVPIGKLKGRRVIEQVASNVEQEGSRIKNPSEASVDMITDHVHAQDVNFSNAFFTLGKRPRIAAEFGEAPVEKKPKLSVQAEDLPSKIPALHNEVEKGVLTLSQNAAKVLRASEAVLADLDAGPALLKDKGVRCLLTNLIFTYQLVLRLEGSHPGASMSCIGGAKLEGLITEESEMAYAAIVGSGEAEAVPVDAPDKLGATAGEEVVADGGAMLATDASAHLCMREKNDDSHGGDAERQQDSGALLELQPQPVAQPVPKNKDGVDRERWIDEWSNVNPRLSMTKYVSKFKVLKPITADLSTLMSIPQVKVFNETLFNVVTPSDYEERRVSLEAAKVNITECLTSLNKRSSEMKSRVRTKRREAARKVAKEQQEQVRQLRRIPKQERCKRWWQRRFLQSSIIGLVSFHW